LIKSLSDNIDASLSWKDIAWLKSITKLPIVLKGVLSPIDAQLAVEHGVAGIIVSSHGARQLDTALPPLRALPAIAEIVRGRCVLMVDGGIRRGTDVCKALALGADAVLIGRPVIYSLAVNGEGMARSAACFETHPK
jgi:isopentenyl diphosphate isomerase/L-lactate dehydrogenase-like FMN-dependent dehydrogenase